jgi:hypothetical protein
VSVGSDLLPPGATTQRDASERYCPTDLAGASTGGVTMGVCNDGEDSSESFSSILYDGNEDSSEL